jgi:hypothetical protein
MTIACVLGVLTPLLLSIFRLHKSEVFGISVLFILSMNFSREILLVYTLGLTISMYFYDVYSGQIVNLRKKLTVSAVFLAAGTVVNISEPLITAGALRMYSGGVMVACIAIVIAYVAAMSKQRSKTAAGLLTGIAFYYILDNVYSYLPVFSMENAYFIFITGLVILPKIYTGKLYSEGKEYLSAGIFIALPLMFMSSVPINFSSSLILGAYNKSNIITGGYNSISDGGMWSVFAVYYYVSILISALLAFSYIRFLMNRTSFRKNIPVRFGRPVIIVFAVTCLMSQSSSPFELILTAFIGFCGFLLYKSEISPEMVFMGYMFSFIIQNESLKTGILSSEEGLFHYIGSIPAVGITTIIFLVAASYISGKYSSKYEAS